ncbi:dhs-6 [Pristionchus pacificus]|nr:dhs-6 [Pristionchus pacificus]
MHNVGKFAGRTALITGASRGIGKQIALKLAKDGANIVVAAKTATPHAKLPGTIYTAAEEIEKAGGKALPIVVDVRNEANVQDCVESAVKKFGGIDILINNASAISLTGTLETDMKRYDLMHSINTRGTFLLSKSCIPYLKQGRNPHILNISPPLLMESRWFANHVAYTMAKYGMSMCVLGMSEELRPDRIAVNALWPLTSIWTAAMEMLSHGEGAAGSRSPQIMADAAYALLSKNSAEYTGNFAIDEDVLRAEGVTDFDKYALDPSVPLTPDFFIPGGTYDHHFSQKKERKASRETINKELVKGEIVDVITKMKGLLAPELVKKINATFDFELTESTGTDKIYLDLKNGSGAIGEGLIPGGADVLFKCTATDFVKMFNGKLSPTTAFMTKKLVIKGNLPAAMKLENLMKKMKK